MYILQTYMYILKHICIYFKHICIYFKHICICINIYVYPFSCLSRRCMGWLIRFIHNRHHACENIVQAYSRHMILMQSHGGLSRDALDELCVAGMDLPANSMLSPTKLRHGTPGSYHVNIKPSRRNSSEDSALSQVLLQIVRDLCRRYGLGTPSPLGLILTFGVTLNGRDVRRDDFCLYVPVLVRRNVRIPILMCFPRSCVVVCVSGTRRFVTTVTTKWPIFLLSFNLFGSILLTVLFSCCRRARLKHRSRM